MRPPAFRPVLLLCLATLAPIAGAAAPPGPARWETARPGELEFSGQLIVRPRAGLGGARDGAARARLEGRVLKHYPETDEYVIATAGPGARPGDAEARDGAELLATGDYEYVQPNWICYPIKEPNDPSFGAQWHHPVMRSPLAWEMTTGSTSVICAVTDTGIDLAHQDLAPHRVPGFNAYTDTAEVDGGAVNDINGHGTHVAGCAAAAGNNAVGVSGVGWDLSVMMVRVAIDSGGGAYLDDILQGARWAVDHGAKVASSSYTGVSGASVQTTGAYIKAAGGLYCYAAGNSGTNWTTFDHPDVIVVGASDEYDNRAGFSGYGPGVDVFAPGTNILSTCNGGGYCPASGTSMATPVCNGVIGMIWSANPALTAQEVEDILFSTCRDLGTPGNDDTFGWGRVDTFEAVQTALADSGPVAPFAVADAAGTPGAEARVIDVLANDFDVNGDEVTIASFDALSASGGTIERLAGAGPGGRDVLVYTSAPGFTGADAFSYLAADPGGLTRAGTVAVTVGDPSEFRTPENPPASAPGVGVDYFALSSSTTVLPDYSALTPYLSQTVPAVNFPSTDGVFAGSGLADDVGARFTGLINIPVTDFYTLSLTSDDGSRLLLGSTVTVNNDGLHGMVEVGATIGLRAGLHAVTVDFFERAGGAGVIVGIAGGGLAKQPVPASMWRRAECPADYNGDGFVDGIDYDTFVNDFESGSTVSDLNGDGFVDGIDYDTFMNEFAVGC